jgi:hypothetical protein
LFEIVAQVPNEERPVQVRTEKPAEAPKLVKESEGDSLDEAELLCRERRGPSAVCPSTANTKQACVCDSSKLFQLSFQNQILNTFFLQVELTDQLLGIEDFSFDGNNP